MPCEIRRTAETFCCPFAPADGFGACRHLACTRDAARKNAGARGPSLFATTQKSVGTRAGRKARQGARGGRVGRVQVKVAAVLDCKVDAMLPQYPVAAALAASARAAPQSVGARGPAAPSGQSRRRAPRHTAAIIRRVDELERLVPTVCLRLVGEAPAEVGVRDAQRRLAQQLCGQPSIHDARGGQLVHYRVGPHKEPPYRWEGAVRRDDACSIPNHVNLLVY